MENIPTYDTGAGREMPRYVSCKRVWALKIASVSINGNPDSPDSLRLVLHFEDPGYAPRTMPENWGPKGKDPQDLIGGYYVVYEDGYPTWSPTEAFERGCTPEAEWGIPVTQERKYGINLRGKLFNRRTGAEVSCPLFIVLAKDTRGLPSLLHYKAAVPNDDTETHAAIAAVIADFDRFRYAYNHLMKDGDTRVKASLPPMPMSINSKPETWAPGEREAPNP